MVFCLSSLVQRGTTKIQSQLFKFFPVIYLLYFTYRLQAILETGYGKKRSVLIYWEPK